MEVRNLAPKSVDAVIMHSYKYDHPYTDMACAWSTVYTVFEINSMNIRTIDCVSGCGEDLEKKAPELNLVALTDEIKERYALAVEKRREEKFKEQIVRYQKELDDYNAKLLPQNKGQIVEVIEGRSKGVHGRITWLGKNKFNSNPGHRGSIAAQALIAYVSQRPYTIPNANCDLIGIKPVEGKTFPNGKEIMFLDPSKLKVIEGYEVVTMLFWLYSQFR